MASGLRLPHRGHRPIQLRRLEQSGQPAVEGRQHVVLGDVDIDRVLDGVRQRVFTRLERCRSEPIEPPTRGRCDRIDDSALPRAEDALFTRSGYAGCLAGFVERLGLGHPHVAGISFGGALALEFHRRHPVVPRTLILASAYAGWAGSLPAGVVEERLRQALVLADLSPEEFVGALLPTMFSEGTPVESVEAFGAAMRAFHPSGFRAMAHASAEDLRDALPLVTVPTLLVYGDKDVRAPLTVAEHLREAIAGSTLVVLPGAGHVCNIEAPDEFNSAVRRFLRDSAS